MKNTKIYLVLLTAAVCLANLILASYSWGKNNTDREQIQSTERWPFRPYAYAKVYTFNFFPARQGVQLRIIQDGRWSRYIRSEQRVTRGVGERVVEIVSNTKGTYLASKCPFPRHAFVFFDAKDQPVASVDICFECGDLFAWPDFKIPNEAKYGVWDHKKKLNIGGLQKEYDDAMSAYRILITRLGLPIEHRQ